MRDEHKQWWEKAILITTKNNQLHKACVRYPEARLIERACQTGRILLENGTAPEVPILRESRAG